MDTEITIPAASPDKAADPREEEENRE